MDFDRLFDFTGKVAVVSGGTGVLCGAIAHALGRCGAQVVILGRNVEKGTRIVAQMEAKGSPAVALMADVTDRARLEAVTAEVVTLFGRVDFLINGAGGNVPEATTSPDLSFFDLPADAVRQVFDVNFGGTFLCCQAFGRVMADQNEGVILNVASMNAIRPLTNVPAYSAAKAAVANFTRWLAVHMARNYSPRIRVNAIAPGFFLTEQNRFLLMDEASGELTPRGQTIVEHTPMGRFGDPEDLIGTVLWLLAGGAAFVTGIVVPVDGGFSAFSGV